MLLSILLLACTQPENAQPRAASPTPPITAPKAESAGLSCCTTPESTALVNAYVAVNAGLAADDDAAATAALGTLAKASATELPDVAAKAAELAPKPIAEKRDGLKTVSRSLIAYTHAHKGGATSVAEAFCPMADAGWIQQGTTIANPYYGSEMLTCGSFK